MIANYGLPLRPVGKRWSDVIFGATNKGSEYGNFSGWTSGQVHSEVEKIVSTQKPEIVIIMVGSNDIRDGSVPANYRSNLEAIVVTCLAAHCIPIINAILPFRDRETAVDEVNQIIRETAH